MSLLFSLSFVKTEFRQNCAVLSNIDGYLGAFCCFSLFCGINYWAHFVLFCDSFSDNNHPTIAMCYDIFSF